MLYPDGYATPSLKFISSFSKATLSAAKATDRSCEDALAGFLQTGVAASVLLRYLSEDSVTAKDGKGAEKLRNDSLILDKPLDKDRPLAEAVSVCVNVTRPNLILLRNATCMFAVLHRRRLANLLWTVTSHQLQSRCVKGHPRG